MEFYICCPKDEKSRIQFGSFWVTDKNPSKVAWQNITFAFFRLYVTAENHIFNLMDKNTYWKLKFIRMFETPDFIVTELKLVELS